MNPPPGVPEDSWNTRPEGDGADKPSGSWSTGLVAGGRRLGRQQGVVSAQWQLDRMLPRMPWAARGALSVRDPKYSSRPRRPLLRNLRETLAELHWAGLRGSMQNIRLR